MGLPIQHQAHHHAGEPRGLIIDRLHLKPGQGKPLGQNLGLELVRRGLDELPKPLERDPHQTSARQRLILRRRQSQALAAVHDDLVDRAAGAHPGQAWEWRC
jgi:hypothetical protein